ncbi:MAG: competence protein, partial [Lachnospiraceae bacterium]|nr:competence protein [Lachnospiraceae bacterium]
CSLVMKISGGKDSLLICGDAHSDELGTFLLKTYGKRMQAKYVQVGHHGNNSFPISFYDAVDPFAVFMDSPAWLLTENGYTAAKLRDSFVRKGTIVYDFRTAPNTVRFE